MTFERERQDRAAMSDYVRGPQFDRLRDGAHDVDLAGLALEFAADVYPELDTREVMDCLARLGNRAREAVASTGGSSADRTRAKLRAVSHVLYVDEGFAGDEDDYYNPRNSYLNEVLVRRRGIPISLGIVYLTVARRAGLSLYGVSTPGHFVLGCAGEDRPLYVDPFDSGDVLSRAACERRIAQRVALERPLVDGDFLPASAMDIALRMLRNLKRAHVLVDGWDSALLVQQRLTSLAPELADERRDLGLMYLRTGEARAALNVLEPYAAGCDSEQAEVLEPYLAAARRMAAEMN